MNRALGQLPRRTLLGAAALPLLTPTLSSAALVGPACLAPPPPPEEPPRLAVSLRLMQEDLDTCARGAACASAARTLYGLTRVSGYALDRRNDDIVLFGHSEPARPALHVDDLAVAWRALRLVYARVDGNTRYYSFPGISIDPAPEMVRRLQEVNAEAAAASADRLDALMDAWREACQVPQAVRIIGVPPSRFAATMLEADYRLKRVVDGDLRPVPALKDMMTEDLEIAIRDALANRRVDLGGMDRFWFVAGDCTSGNGNTAVVLDRCDVWLLTEQEMTSKGTHPGGGDHAATATRFACDVSRLFPVLAADDTAYEQLEALYRWMALVRLMIDRAAADEVHLDMAVLENRHRLQQVEIPQTLPGRFAVGSQDLRDGNTTHFLRLPSCGGVKMAFDKNKVQPAPRYQKVADDWAMKVVTARPGAGRQPFWSVT